MFTGAVLLALLVSLVVVGLIVWVCFWALQELKLPEPFNKAARVVLVLFAAGYLISLLLPFTKI